MNFSCRYFLGSVCSLTFIFNHPLLLPIQFLQLFRFRFAGFAFFWLQLFRFFFRLQLLFRVCCFPSCSSSSRCLALISQTSPSAQPLSSPKTNNDSLGNGEFEFVPVNNREAFYPMSSSALWWVSCWRTSEPSRNYIIAKKKAEHEKQPLSDADIRAWNDKPENVKQQTQLKQIPLRWCVC